MRVVQAVADGEPRTVTGKAVDLAGVDIATETVRDAIRGTAESAISVDCPGPSRWWEPLAVPTGGTPPLDRLVAAARSRGVSVPEERALAAADRELAAHEVEDADREAARKRLAAAGEEVAALREAVAAARGQLEARRDVGAGTEAAEAALEDATARLAEAETERVAAEQAHERAQRRARRARSTRERRLELQDRVKNRRRDARRALVRAVADRFEDAVEAVPGDATLSTDPLRVTGDTVAAGLAAVRLADLHAPVVDDTGRFRSAAAAADRLDARVIRC
jgi:hypothetical protein